MNMHVLKNSADYPYILEIARTTDVSYTDGAFKLKPAGFLLPGGFKIKCKTTGVLKVQYLGDADDRIVDLTITENDIHLWLSDRLVKIVESGTTIPAENILIGW